MTAPTWHYENFDPTGSAVGYRITRKLDEVQSPFQKIEIFESTDWGNLMLIDGAMMLTTRDNFFYHEMMSHPALFTHAAPKNVVIIGGGTQVSTHGDDGREGRAVYASHATHRPGVVRAPDACSPTGRLRARNARGINP